MRRGGEVRRAADGPTHARVGVSVHKEAASARRTVVRVQTGVRMERRLLNVLKALADLHDITLGELLEAIVLHAFEGRAPFSPDGLAKIAALKQVFDLDLGAGDRHLLTDQALSRRARVGSRKDNQP